MVKEMHIVKPRTPLPVAENDASARRRVAKKNILSFKASTRHPVDEAKYRDAMALLGSTVFLMAVQRGHERIDRIVTSVFSLSIEPPSILVGIKKGSLLADAVMDLKKFSVSALADDQQPLAYAYARDIDAELRPTRQNWTPWNSEQPRLVGALVSMDCELAGVVEVATHLLVAGSVVDLRADTLSKPLIRHQKEYTTLVRLI